MYIYTDYGNKSYYHDVVHGTCALHLLLRLSFLCMHKFIYAIFLLITIISANEIHCVSFLSLFLGP